MGAREKPRILVVEDEPDVATAIGRLLRKKFAAQVVIAGDAASALEALSSSGPFDLVTLDFQLPDGDGLHLLQDIVDKGYAHRVVMVTGHGDEEVAAAALRAGVDGYVRKDDRLAGLLIEVVEKALSEPAGKTGKLDEDRILWQRDILDEIDEAVIATDAGEEFLVTFWSKGAERIYGWKAEEVIGRPVLEVITQGRITAPGEGVLDDIHNRGRFSGAIVRYHRDGTRIHVETSSVEQKDERGNIIGYIAVHRRIATDRDD